MENEQSTDQPNVDGVTAPEPEVPQQTVETPPPEAPPVAVNPVMKKRMQFILLFLVCVPYALFFFWCLFLMSVLPSVTGQFESLIPIGRITGFGGAGILGMLVLVGLNRTLATKKMTPMSRVMGSLKMILFASPGIALGLAMPFVIAGEPPLSMAITDPIALEDFVAPLPITFDVQPAIDILQRRGVRPVSYAWDYNNDGQIDEQTGAPTVTAYFDRAGGKMVVAHIRGSDGLTRKVHRAFTIPKEVFRITPLRPVIDEPVIFSVEHLVDSPSDVSEIKWDFDGDGAIDQSTIVERGSANELKATKTYLRLGEVTVRATVILNNSTVKPYERTITIHDPLPLPFEVDITTNPEYLISPPPFAVEFEVATEEELRDVKWEYDDGKEDAGERTVRTFRQKGEYTVTAIVRSLAGDLAKITKVVQVVDALSIPDLTFNGTPDVNVDKNEINGEVPLTIQITPNTSLPLIQFFWEAPKASEVKSTETELHAIYRRPGTYNLVLLAQDPEGSVMRRVFRVNVAPPSSTISIRMRPEKGEAPLTVMFDASETRVPGEEITGFEWLFGDEPEGALPKPGSAALSHTYFEPGTYEVHLYARTTKGNRFDTKRTIVVRPPLLNACFTASRTSGNAPLGVKFNSDCTTGQPTELEWEFGDGASSDQPSPIHVFEKPGRYLVKFTLRDSSGNTSIDSLTITAQ